MAMTSAEYLYEDGDDDGYCDTSNTRTSGDIYTYYHVCHGNSKTTTSHFVCLRTKMTEGSKRTHFNIIYIWFLQSYIHGFAMMKLQNYAWFSIFQLYQYCKIIIWYKALRQHPHGKGIWSAMTWCGVYLPRLTTDLPISWHEHEYPVLTYAL